MSSYFKAEEAGEELILYRTQVRARAVDREGLSHNRHPRAVGEQ